MPTYGKGRASRQRPNYPPLGKRIIVDHSPLPRQKKTRVRYLAAHPWEVNATKYSQVVRTMQFSPRAFARQRALANHRPSVVVEWGCGTGDAIRTISEEGRLVKCYGISRDSYPSWNSSRNVKFIQETPDRAVRYLKRLKGIDLIYSHWGLNHMYGKRGQGDINHFANYVNELITTLRVGGRIVFFPVVKSVDAKFWQELLDPTGKKVKVRIKDLTIFIERKT